MPEPTVTPRDWELAAGVLDRWDEYEGTVEEMMADLSAQARREGREEGLREDWRPWSTAPKDQEILAWREDAGVLLVEWTTPDTLDPSILELSPGVYEVRYGDMDCSAPDWFCLAPECRLEGDELPTHWMPLPGAPPRKENAMPEPTTRDLELAQQILESSTAPERLAPKDYFPLGAKIGEALAMRFQEGREEGLRGVLALINEVRAWQDETFPNATPEGVAKHLQEEAAELLADPRSPEELADCMMLVVCCADLAGVSLVDAVRAKLEVVKAREWEFDPERGYHKARRETQPAPKGAEGAGP